MFTENRHKILVVEDEGLVAHDIATRLERLGHIVVGTCGTAAEAIEMAAGAEIVLMDIRLDGRADGIEAAAEIRERYQLPVVFLTGQSDRATIERAKAADPFGYIVKPLAQATLETSIEMALYKHRMERELRRREAWLSTIFTSVADAVIVADPQGRIVMLNRAAEVLTGWTQPEATGKALDKIVRLIELSAEPFDPVGLAILRDAPVGLGRSTRLISRTGRELMVEGSAAPVKAAGAALGVALTLRDVSARRWQESQSRQAHKMEAVSRLAAGVANEYTNLFAAIRTQTAQLLEQFGEYAPARKSAQQIEEAASAAEKLNRRLSALGTRQVGHMEVLSLNAVIRKSAPLIESLAGSAVGVSIRLDPAAVRIKADPDQIEQTLMGLVMHAASAMANGGRLLIETAGVEIPLAAAEPAHTMLALTYTAQEADPEKLFEPASMEEAGVALPKIHAIVTEHGGYISAQATEAGGCRIEALFPSFAARGEIEAARTASADAPVVLLVEAHDQVRSEIHNYFEARGYNLLEAADAAEALAVAEMHEAPIEVAIANASDAAALGAELKSAAMLRMVDEAERAENEIRRPFTEQALLERVEALMKPNPAIAGGA